MINIFQKLCNIRHNILQRLPPPPPTYTQTRKKAIRLQNSLYNIEMDIEIIKYMFIHTIDLLGRFCSMLVLEWKQIFIYLNRQQLFSALATVTEILSN